MCLWKSVPTVLMPSKDLLHFRNRSQIVNKLSALHLPFFQCLHLHSGWRARCALRSPPVPQRRWGRRRCAQGRARGSAPGARCGCSSGLCPAPSLQVLLGVSAQRRAGLPVCARGVGGAGIQRRELAKRRVALGATLVLGDLGMALAASDRT